MLSLDHVFTRKSLFDLALAAALGGSGLASQSPGVSYYGNGCAGSFTTPEITAIGVPMANAGMSLKLTGFPGPGTHVLFVGTQSNLDLSPFGFPGCHLYAQPAATLQFAAGPLGTVEIPVPPFGASTVGAQLSLQTAFRESFANRIGFSKGLQLDVQPSLPPNSGLGSAPAHGLDGTRVRLVGRFDNQYRPIDVLVRSKTARAVVGAGGVEALGDTFIVETLDHFSPFAAKAKLQAAFGTGATAPITNPSWQSASSGWAHVRKPTDPIVDMPTEFEPDGQTLIPCSANLMEQRIPLHLATGGQVEFQYPLDGTGTADICAGDEMEFWVSVELASGEIVTITSIDPIPFAVDTDWATFGPPLSQVLASLLNLVPSSATFAQTASSSGGFRLSASGSTIVAVDPASFVKLVFNPSQHTVSTFTYGTRDNYVGVEPSTRSTAFDANYFIPQTNQPGIGIIRYDESPGCDRFFGDTLDGFGPGGVRTAVLELRIKGFGCQTNTDSVNLGWNGLPYGSGARFEWGRRMVDIADLGFAWTPGQDATICFRLDALPYLLGPDFHYRNVLNAMVDGELELVIEDDTMIDFAELRIVRKL